MAGNRGNVLRAVVATLENSNTLVSILKHTKGATSVRAGARILGDDIRLDDLPLPSLVLSTGAGTGIDPRREISTWTLAATIYGQTVYQVVDVLDALEDLAVNWVRNPSLPQALNRFRVDSHEELDAVGPAGRVIAVRVNLEVSWISN